LLGSKLFVSAKIICTASSANAIMRKILSARLLLSPILSSSFFCRMSKHRHNAAAVIARQMVISGAREDVLPTILPSEYSDRIIISEKKAPNP
jgi:hypothetical protein